ncbi:MAG: hypothetical protein KJ915_04540 [Candidatus Omnitrophica bacterium]|nr:hypothetical protein [Candidatus Omnitrophota bacterium]
MNKKHTLKCSLEKFNFSNRQRIALLLCNYIPILQVLLIVIIISLPWAMLKWRIGLAVAVLYILPPIVARCVLKIWPIRQGSVSMSSRDYFVWWFVLNLQIIFCRFPFLEELMRIIPGAYSAWLRLWGSRIGSFTYWAAGLRVLDRSFLDIGNGVVFGAGVRLNPHVIAENDDGQMELMLARIHIGDRAIIGGYSLLTAGTRIADDENTRACLISPPFSNWKGGKRIEKNIARGVSGEHKD